MPLFSKFLGDPNRKELRKLEPVVEKVSANEGMVESLSNEDLRAKTSEFKKRVADGESLDNILPEAYAVVREAAKRTLEQRHYDVQVMGGIALHQGKIAEMKTGEGKTLSSTLPVYLNALSGRGVHVVTVNDYLSRRDAVWMGQVYDMLGLSVGSIVQHAAYLYDPTYKTEDGDKEDEGSERDEERDLTGSFRIEDSYLRPVERKKAYEADITYGTNNEFGFDYLRDNLAYNKDKKVQRGHYFAIVDEVDSILIDESRTPLIISTPDEESTDLYKTFSDIVPRLQEDEDYAVDHKLRSVNITESGIEKVEKALRINNIYDPSEAGIRYVHSLEQALKANAIFVRDKNYVVRDGEVVIVDEFTGRLTPGRRYSDGLHQAIEAKEGVEVKKESRTQASITYQNYFRMYEKLAGMTGTAKTSEEEFFSVYKLEIVEIPTNKPLIREFLPDLIYRTENGKYKALMQDIKERHEKGQPILIGTASIEKNEYISKYLQKEGIKHELLNAKNHEREAEIIAQAGRESSVTVATNMAGRGVDIILGGNPPDAKEAEKVKKLGGLHVVGTERHEARRIDNQLRGRAGRQGDPGSSQFYLSLEDDLLKAFGGDKITGLMQTLNVPEDQPIQSKIVSNAVENAQAKIEGYHFDSRKHLLEFDEVVNKHRQTIYNRRDEILNADNEGLREVLWNYVGDYLENLFSAHLSSEYKQDWDIKEIVKDVKAAIPVNETFDKNIEKIFEQDKEPEETREEIKKFITEFFDKVYKKREEKAGEKEMQYAVRWVMLRTIDTAWMNHLDDMNHLRDSVQLRAYSQRNPLVEYKNEGLQMFQDLVSTISTKISTTIFKVEVKKQVHGDHTHTHIHTGQPSRGAGVVPSASNEDNSASNESAQTEQVQGAEEQKNKEIGRNDPCYCGSGKKYKKCHGA